MKQKKSLFLKLDKELQMGQKISREEGNQSPNQKKVFTRHNHPFREENLEILSFKYSISKKVMDSYLIVG